MMVDLEELTELVELDQKCNGFKNMNVYLPSSLPTLHVGGTQFAQLDFKVVDSLTGSELTEIGHWSMQIECYM